MYVSLYKVNCLPNLTRWAVGEALLCKAMALKGMDRRPAVGEALLCKAMAVRGMDRRPSSPRYC